jgi:hypothetical protein
MRLRRAYGPMRNVKGDYSCTASIRLRRAFGPEKYFALSGLKDLLLIGTPG